MTFSSEIVEGLRISWASIRANKLRSSLTMLGVVIGIVTVTVMATAIEGLHQTFMQSIAGLGSDVFYIERFPWKRPEQFWKMWGRRPLIVREGMRLAEESKAVRAISIEASGNYPVTYGNRGGGNIRVVGNTAQSALVRGLTVKEGRFFNEADVAGGRPVCVLAADVAARLFPHESPIGARIRVSETTFEVIGVLDKFGKFLFGDIDNQVIVPITRFISDLRPRPYVSFMVKVSTPDQMEEAREELRGAMRTIRQVKPGEDDDFSLNQQEIIINDFNKVGGTIAAVGLFITALSLFVGGIGIMNIMFVSVAERTREIGTRKALGARQRTILLQFLIESAMICLIGGLIGLCITYPASLLLKNLLPTKMPLHVALLAILISLITGVIAGFLPAYRAARLNPVDALRAE